MLTQWHFCPCMAHCTQTCLPVDVKLSGGPLGLSIYTAGFKKIVQARRLWIKMNNEAQVPPPAQKWTYECRHVALLEPQSGQWPSWCGADVTRSRSTHHKSVSAAKYDVSPCFYSIKLWSMLYPLTWRTQGLRPILQPSTRDRSRGFGFTFEYLSCPLPVYTV